MSTYLGETPPTMNISPLPAMWEHGTATGSYTTANIRPSTPLHARVRVFEQLEANTQYLLDRLGTRTIGPLGRPHVASLPTELPEGVSVLAFDESPAGALTARIDLVRRAWDHDILVSARELPVEAVDEVYDAMVELLAAVHPTRTAL